MSSAAAQKEIALSAVVPATDEPVTLDRCLAALRSSSRPPDEVVVIEEPRGAGPAAARNAGVRACRGALIAFVDSDVEVDRQAIARLAARLDADEELAAVFGGYDDAPAAPGVVSRFRNLLHHHVHACAAGPADTFWAGLGLIRRDAFEAVSGFDAERYTTASIEDIELGVRLRAAGYRILLDPTATGTHLKRWTLGSMVRVDVVSRAIPWTRLALERGRVPTSLNLAWRHRLGALASCFAVAALLGRRPRPALAGAGALVASDLAFYGLLRRRGGLTLLAAGVPLHLVHHLAGVTGAFAGAALHLGGRRG